MGNSLSVSEVIHMIRHNQPYSLPSTATLTSDPQSTAAAAALEMKKVAQVYINSTLNKGLESVI